MDYLYLCFVKKNQLILFLLLFHFGSFLLANIQDSTLNKLEGIESADEKVRILVLDGWIIHPNSPEDALEYVQMAEKDSGNVTSAFLLDSLYRLKAYCYGDMNNRSATLNSHLSRLRALSSLKEQTKAHYGAYYETAGVIINQRNAKLAKVYYLKAYDVAQQLENKTPLGEIMIKLAEFYVDDEKPDSAIYMLEESRKIFKENERLQFIMGTIDLRIAKIYKRQNNRDSVLEKVRTALLYADTTKFIDYNALIYADAGALYAAYGEAEKAIPNLKMAEYLCNRYNKFFYLPNIYKSFAIAYQNNNVEKAYEYLSKYVEMNDTVISKANNAKVAELQLKYEDEMKELKINNLEKDKMLVEAESSRKSALLQTVGIALAVVVMLLVGLVFMVKQVRSKNKLVNQQKLEVEERNKEIEDSINYAKRIQEAMIPQAQRLKRIFPKSFSIYLPKDNLSGDFYWVYDVTTNAGTKLNLFALGDCTGHGVPGALLSILGINYLNLGAVSSEVNSPGDALDYLNDGIKNTFGYSKELIRDGMDIVMGAIDLSNDQLYYACAKNPIYVVRNKELTVLKGDSKAIGNDDKADDFQFSNFSFQLQKGDMIYCFSDGYQDQFGGEKGKKFKLGSLKRLITELDALPIEEQKQRLLTEFSQWKGGNEQIDDVTVMGLRY